MEEPKITDIIDMEKDLIKHPSDDLNYMSEILSIFSKEEISSLNSALNIILNDEKLTQNEKGNLLENSWKINRKFKVPTPSEFLTSKWIGPQADDLYPHCKKTFIDFFDPKVNKNKLITYCCTGWGKSTLLDLIKYYRALLTISLRNPTSYLHLAKSTRLTDVTISFTKATAFDLVIKGLVTILETSPMCQRVHYERDMNNPEYTESGKILFCNTSKGNSMIRIGDIYFDVASEPMSLVGRNIVSASITETSFLSTIMPEERVMKLLNEMMTRVYNRFGYNNPNTTIVMDSSPNSLECKADQWVLQHKNDPDVLFINDKKWEVQPWVTPIWEKDHTKTFPMFKGTSTQPTKIITEEEREKYDDDLIMDMPIDLYELAKDDASKILRDFGACPTASTDSKLISNYSIIEKCFVPNLPNIYAYCYASSLLAPEGLLWNEIRDLIFVYSGKGNLYKLKRYPKIERFIHIDLAEKKDMASISMVHIECDKYGQKLYVIDFILPILCKKEDKINIDAFKYLVSDIKELGQVNLKHVSYDRFQSSSSIQYLQRKGFECENLSVDNNIEYYLSFNGYLLQNRIKCGRNLVFKNNLRSLILTTNGHHGKGTSGKLTVDHTQGDFSDLENFDWETSNLGKNGKDSSDSVCGAITLCEKYGTLDASAFYDYDEENMNLEEKERKEMQSVETRLKNEFGLVFA